MIHFTFSVLFVFLITVEVQPILSTLPQLPSPEPIPIQNQQQQLFLPNPSPPATIPSFPEQAAVSGCSVTQLPKDDQLLSAVNSACIVKKKHKHDDEESQLLHRSRCCPVLAAWLYTSYEEQYRTKSPMKSKKMWYEQDVTETDKSRDMPLLPVDTETCGEGIEKVMKDKGFDIDRMRPNSTCDLLYCYCGIRLHPFSCPAPEILSVDSNGNREDAGLKRLEKDCSSHHSSSSSSSSSNNGGLTGCSKCLHSLYKFKKTRKGNATKSEDRTSKMRGRDCELMGLTWLLAQNRTAYMHTVTSVLGAIMMSKDGTDPRSCSLNSDGMPLAVDSSEISTNSVSSRNLCFMYLYAISLAMMYFLMSRFS